ncbi:hypothetical protein QQF61_29575, partial [Klebsiella pneumoniae]|nr:hypothetical protein [Klebsiella pneumoniae]MDK9338770.1 hypothetical protein [Klebsiella pneumoniae]MDK9387407.1 hypothetical protein [Klebsiella pneumoniae]MDK9398396.1 hypothetical protein [Klebsiella pneumoniae]MDK9404106.1 hypothetical protein [Klebsiella pneumoniae]
GKNSLNRLIRCVCGKKIGPDPRNFNQRVSLGRNDLLIRTFPSAFQASLVFLIFPLIAVSLESYIYGKTISTYSILLIIPLVIGILITLIPKKTVVDKNKMNS